MGGERRDRFAGARLAAPRFAGDTGEVAPEVAAALSAYAEDPNRYAEAVAALRGSRVLVPVSPVPVLPALDEVEDDHGRPHDKSSALAAVFLQGRDGRRALLAFTGLAPLHAWQPDARPVPAPATEAARTAVQEGAAALVVDLAGPVTLVVEGDDLAALAAGWIPGRVGDKKVWIGLDRNQPDWSPRKGSGSGIIG